MTERFERLYELPNNLFSAGSPIIVLAGVLLKDTQSGRVIVQLKFRNISAFSIKALKVHIVAFDAAGEEIEGVHEYQYLDLKIQSGVAFGANRAIVLPNPVTRSFALCGVRVVLENNMVKDVPIPLLPLPQAKSLQSVLSNVEMLKQYRFAINEKAVSVPQAVDELWQCACGEWNGVETCTTCGVNKVTVFSAFDLTSLAEKMEKRLKEEKAERERIAAEEAKRHAAKEAKNRAIMRKVKIAVAIIVPIVALTLLFSLWLYPDVVKPGFEYKAAQELLANEQYDNAVAAFTALGDYKDSAAMVQESMYQKANALFDEQKYDETAKLYYSLGEYKASVEKAKEAVYQKACVLFNNNVYNEAAELYSSLGEYKDCTAKISECRIATLDSNYESAIELMNAGKYEEAYDIFVELGDYQDSAEQLLHFKWICDQKTETKPNGIYTYEYMYDENGNIEKEVVTTSNEHYKNTEYTYDKNGNLLLSVSTTLYGEVLSTEYTYDNNGRLVQSVLTPSLGEVRTTKYSYDDDGRLVLEVCTLSDGDIETTEYSHNENGDIVKTVWIGSLGGNKTTEYSYDDDGHVQKETWIYTMLGYTISSGEAIYSYNMRLIYIP